MRFSLAEQLIDCSLMKHDRFWPETAPEVAEAAVAALDRYGSVVFKIGMLRLDGDASRRLAYRIADELRDELIRSVDSKSGTSGQHLVGSVDDPCDAAAQNPHGSGGVALLERRRYRLLVRYRTTRGGYAKTAIVTEVGGHIYSPWTNS